MGNVIMLYPNDIRHTRIVLDAHTARRLMDTIEERIDDLTDQLSNPKFALKRGAVKDMLRVNRNLKEVLEVKYKMYLISSKRYYH